MKKDFLIIFTFSFLIILGWNVITYRSDRGGLVAENGDMFFQYVPADIDTEINSRVTKALKGGKGQKGYENIVVEVNAGNVILRGNVGTEEDYKNIMDRVSRVPGVRDIDNKVKVTNRPANW